MLTVSIILVYSIYIIFVIGFLDVSGADGGGVK